MKIVPRTCLPLCWLLLCLAASGAAAAGQWTIARENGAVIVRDAGGQTLLQYQLERPAGSKLTVESACYFHPVATPLGTVVTEAAPDDHPHHRGLFLAWVEMHGRKDADFWGWGEPAPKNDRRIVNTKISKLKAGRERARFRAHNVWQAEGETLINEKLDVEISAAPAAHVIDLNYTLTADADLRLARWAFSGFCARLRREGRVEVSSPQGAPLFPNPKHTQPESDWPDAPWYDCTTWFNDGKVAGAAILNHPQNPPTLWHNHRDTRILNPCIVAPGDVLLKAGRPLQLRYRAVVHDGPAPTALLNQLHAEWSK